MYFVSFCSRFIDRFAPCVLFRRAVWAHQFTVTLTCTNANETVAIDVQWLFTINVGESGYAISSWSASAGYSALDVDLWMLKLTRLWLVNFYHPQSTSLPNIQHYLIMTGWITLQYSPPPPPLYSVMRQKSRRIYFIMVKVGLLSIFLAGMHFGDLSSIITCSLPSGLQSINMVPGTVFMSGSIYNDVWLQHWYPEKP